MFTERFSALAQNDTETGASPLLWLTVAVVVVALILVLTKTLKSRAASVTKPGPKFRPTLTAEDVEGIRFQPPKFGERGYDPDQVSHLLTQTVIELRRLAEENQRLQQQKADPLSPPVLMSSAVITPEQVVKHKFSTTRFPKGLSQNKVDDFLDLIVVGLRQWNAENARLRSELSGNTLGDIS